MSEFYSALMLARHVSGLISPSSGAFFTSCIRRFGCVVIATQQPDVSEYIKCDVQFIKVAPDDGLI